MRWQNIETPTFAGSAGSAGEPAIVETMQLLDRDGTELAAFEKSVDGAVGLRVNANVNAQTGTAYTLTVTDNGKWITCNNAAAVTVTVPAGLGQSFSCVIQQIGAGQVSLSASGTTLNNVDTQTAISGQYGLVTLFAYAANTFVVSGNTA